MTAAWSQPSSGEMLGTIGSEELGALLADIIGRDAAAMLGRIDRMAELSPDFDAMLSGLLAILHDTAVAQVLPEGSDLVDGTCRDFARRLDREAVQLYYQVALNGRRDLQMAPDPRTAFEMTMIRMLAFQPWQASGAAETGSGHDAGSSTGPETAEPAVKEQSGDRLEQSGDRLEQSGGRPEQSGGRPALAGNDDWHQLISAMALGRADQGTGVTLYPAGVPGRQDKPEPAPRPGTPGGDEPEGQVADCAQFAFRRRHQAGNNG